MKTKSIFFSIGVAFFISLLVSIFAFSVIMLNIHHNLEHELQKKYYPLSFSIARSLRKSGLNQQLRINLKKFNLKLFIDSRAMNKILRNPHTKVEINEVKNKLLFRVLEYNGFYYVYIKAPNLRFIFKDKTKISEDNALYVVSIFIFIILILILAFYSTIKKLLPLKRIRKKVKRLGEEDFDFSCCQLTDFDEISLLGKELKNSAGKLESLKKTRHIFIKNIVYSLKQNIVEGNVLSKNLGKEETNCECVEKIFKKLDYLVGEFIASEELIFSSNYLERSTYCLADIVDAACESLNFDSKQVQSKYKNLRLKVNFKFFTLAIKHLIDNAVKYSIEDTMFIRTKDEDIIFGNKGNRLALKLEKYLELSYDINEKENLFGLGLCMIQNILNANSYSLKYDYIDETNLFTICKNP